MKYHWLALGLFLIIIMAFSWPRGALAQSTSPSKNNAALEELKQDIHHERPSITYVVFEPAIRFFQRLVAISRTIARFVQPKNLGMVLCTMRLTLPTQLRTTTQSLCK